MRLENKTALITGGGRGIGAATAFLFAQQGATVGILDLNPEHIRSFSEKAEKRALNIKTYHDPGRLSKTHGRTHGHRQRNSLSGIKRIRFFHGSGASGRRRIQSQDDITRRLFRNRELTNNTDRRIII